MPLSVENGQKYTVPLKVPIYRFRVRSDQPARVYVGADLMGETPTKDLEVDTSNVTVRLSPKDLDFNGDETNVQLVAEETKVISVPRDRFKRGQGVVVVTSNLPGTEFFVDGESKGRLNAFRFHDPWPWWARRPKECGCPTRISHGMRKIRVFARFFHSSWPWGGRDAHAP